MGKSFNTQKEFEEILYKTIKEKGEIALGRLVAVFTPEEKSKIRELYKTQTIGRKIEEILSSARDKFVCVSKTGTNKNDWRFKVKENVTVQTKDIDTEKPKNIKNKLEPDDDSLPESLIEDETMPEEEVEGEGSSEKEIPIDENLKQEILQSMVLIDDSFSISKFLVTQKLYETVMGNNPSKFKDEPCGKESQEKRPVETVSYLEAIQFCNKLSELCGFSSCYNGDVYNENVKGFRLPTEREWYDVATGKKSNSFIYAGSNVPDGFAWYKHNSKSKTHEVGKKQPVMINETNGIFDMSGNVWEWVMADIKKDKALCVGGSYADSEDYLELGKPNNKFFTDKNTKNSTIGFRICVNSLD